jgi:hypothetical protein
VLEAANRLTAGVMEIYYMATVGFLIQNSSLPYELRQTKPFLT